MNEFSMLEVMMAIMTAGCDGTGECAKAGACAQDIEYDVVIGTVNSKLAAEKIYKQKPQAKCLLGNWASMKCFYRQNYVDIKHILNDGDIDRLRQTYKEWLQAHHYL